jgi:DNA-binding GntR family transcriptional regulator
LKVHVSETSKTKDEKGTAISDEIVQLLLTALSNGEIQPGAFIKESVVARQLGVSRGPLREALSQLEGRQLVERVHGLGVRVIEGTLQDLASLFEVRSALEALACRLAATVATDAELAEIERLAYVWAPTQTPPGEHSYRQDEDFHFCIIKASGNPRLIAILMENLYYPIRLYRYHRARTKPERVQAARLEHHEIVACLKRRDPDAAEAAMRRHIENARAFMLSEGHQMTREKPKLRFS